MRRALTTGGRSLLRSLGAEASGSALPAVAVCGSEAAAAAAAPSGRGLASQVRGHMRVCQRLHIKQKLQKASSFQHELPALPSLSSPMTQADGGSCPHHAAAHAYLDSHRAHDTPTYRVAPDGRVQVAEGSSRAGVRQQLWAGQHRAAAGPAGPATSALHDLCTQFGVEDKAAFVRAVHKLHVERQHALLEHAGGVADLLQVRGASGGRGLEGAGCSAFMLIKRSSHHVPEAVLLHPAADASLLAHPAILTTAGHGHRCGAGQPHAAALPGAVQLSCGGKRRPLVVEAISRHLRLFGQCLQLTVFPMQAALRCWRLQLVERFAVPIRSPLWLILTHTVAGQAAHASAS